jgi:acetyl esterase/lipase
MRNLIAIAGIAGLLPAAFAAEPAGKLIPDIVYTTVGKQALQLDLVVPKTPGPHPCVVCFHGGAWRAGSRKDLTKPALFAPGGKDVGLMETLAKAGYAAASVSYRLAPNAKFPAQIEDAKTAVRFLRSNAKKYDLDPDKFAALGFSAGGHLAALLGTTDSKAGFDGTDHPNVSSKVQAVVDFFGPTDMVLYCETPAVNESFMAPFLGKECLKDQSKHKLASPIEYVTKEAPPFLIIHGTADIIVPILHSERFQRKLNEAGVKNELVTIRGKGHGWDSPDAVETSQKAVLKFLAETLPPAGAKK